jgi:hypothetical protein
MQLNSKRTNLIISLNFEFAYEYAIHRPSCCYWSIDYEQQVNAYQKLKYINVNPVMINKFTAAPETIPA